MKESRRRKPKPSKIVGLFVHMPKSILMIVVALAASAMFVWADEPREKEITTLGDIVVTATKTPHTLKDVPVETIVITRGYKNGKPDVEDMASGRVKK
jgi:outer membrane cobalamin receptor